MGRGTSDAESIAGAPRSRFEAYMARVGLQQAAHSDWRSGQTYFNVLYFDGFDPELADELRGGPLDPFNQDELIPAFLEEVRSRWEQSV